MPFVLPDWPSIKSRYWSVPVETTRAVTPESAVLALTPSASLSSETPPAAKATVCWVPLTVKTKLAAEPLFWSALLLEKVLVDRISRSASALTVTLWIPEVATPLPTSVVIVALSELVIFAKLNSRLSSRFWKADCNVWTVDFKVAKPEICASVLVVRLSRLDCLGAISASTKAVTNFLVSILEPTWNAFKKSTSIAMVLAHSGYKQLTKRLFRVFSDNGIVAFQRSHLENFSYCFIGTIP